MPTLIAPPLLMGPLGIPGVGVVTARAIRPFFDNQGNLVTGITAKGTIVGGQFFGPGGTPFVIPATPPNETLEIWVKLDSWDGEQTKLETFQQRTVKVADQATVTWADGGGLIDTVPVREYASGDYIVPSVLYELIEARDTILVSTVAAAGSAQAAADSVAEIGTLATDISASADNANESASRAEASAVAAEAPTETALANILGNPDSAPSKQLTATFVQPQSMVQNSAVSHTPGPRAGRTIRQISTSGTGHNAFPALALTRDRSRLVALWRNGSDHVWGGGSGKGVIQTAYSEDLGSTWSAPVTAFSAADDLRDPNAVTLSDGTILCSGFHHDGANSLNIYVIASADNGETWASRATISPATAQVVRPSTCGSILESPGGVLLMPIYGAQTGESYTSVKLLRSTDAGVTWAYVSTIVNGVAASKSYNETVIGYVPDGRLMALIRMGNSEIYRSYSTNNGVTWSAETKVFDGYGRPMWIDHQGGGIFTAFKDILYGSLGRGGAMLSGSYDSGATWTTPEEFHPAVVSPGAFFTYAALVPVARGVVAMAYSMQTADNAADVWFRFVTEGTPSPLGDVVAAPLAVDASLRLGDMVAFDTFRRADQALFHSDSDNRWEGDSGLGILGGRAAHVAGSGARSRKVMNAGVSDVVVESSFLYTGSIGHGMILRYIDSSNYLYITMESSSTAIRVYSVDSGVTTTPAIAEKTGLIYRANTWNDLRAVCRGDRLKVFLDGEKIIDATFSSAVQTKFGAASKHGILTIQPGQSWGPITIRR